jgi:putative ampG protein
VEKKRNPITWVPSVYFGMGLPYIALSTVSVLIFADLKVDKELITFWTSLLVLPWSLKPLFSFVMELFGTKRQYVFITEAIMSLMFGLVCFALPLPSFFSITIALFAVLGISGSIQDIAGDGIYMQELSAKEQSIYAGWQGGFYNLAKILANGGLVFLAGRLSKSYGVLTAWMVVIGICALIMIALSLYHMTMLPKESKRASVNRSEKTAELWEMISSFFTKKYIWLYLLFIFLYRLGEGLAVKIAPLFLKDTIELGGLGLSNEVYGLIYGTAGSIAFVLGSILSGYFVASIGLKRALFALVCIFNIPFAVYLLLAYFQPTSLLWIGTGIVFEYFSYGFGFVGITLFMMQQIAPGKYQMAHYAFANSLMNLSVMLPGMLSGRILHHIGGYQPFFVLVLVVTLPVILLSLRLPFAHGSEEKIKSVTE